MQNKSPCNKCTFPCNNFKSCDIWIDWFSRSWKDCTGIIKEKKLVSELLRALEDKPK